MGCRSGREGVGWRRRITQRRDDGARVVAIMAQAQGDFGDAQLRCSLCGLAVQRQAACAVGQFAHFDVAPVHACVAEGKRLDGRFLGRETRCQAFGRLVGVLQRISDLALGEKALHEALAKTVERFADATDLHQVQADTQSVRGKGSRLGSAGDQGHGVSYGEVRSPQDGGFYMGGGLTMLYRGAHFPALEGAPPHAGVGVVSGFKKRRKARHTVSGISCPPVNGTQVTRAPAPRANSASCRPASKAKLGSSWPWATKTGMPRNLACKGCHVSKASRDADNSTSASTAWGCACSATSQASMPPWENPPRISGSPGASRFSVSTSLMTWA